MSKLVRLIVALVLALAIPVQAMSAVMAGICMASGHHAVDADDHQHDHHGDSQDGAAPHQHGDGQSSEAHCPPCVACCAAASISSAFSRFVPEPPAAAPIAAAPYRAAGFQLDGLDRPPLAL